ncbi:hypothetical protein GCM10009677_36520 [Sphaerisporangium rubeum]
MAEFAGEVGEAGVERGQELGGGVAAVLVHPLVAGGADVAGLDAGELPDDPVGGLDPAVGQAVDLRVLLQHLQALGELPFGGDLAAVPGQPRLAALGGERVDAVGVRLRGVVLPQFGPRVRPVGVDLAERRAVRGGRQHGAGGEVRADADHLGRRDAGDREGLRHRVAQDVAPVLGGLQGPVGPEPHIGAGQPVLDHPVCVLVHGAPQFGPVGHPHDHRAPRQGAEIDADDVRLAVSVHKALQGNRRNGTWSLSLAKTSHATR